MRENCSAPRILVSSNVLFIFFILSSAILYAQVEAPNPDFLFDSDNDRLQALKQNKIKNVLNKGSKAGKQAAFTAPKIEFDQQNNAMKGSGGVLISKDGVQASAEEGTYYTESKDVDLSGDVFFSWPEGDVVASRAEANIDKQIGEFHQANFYFDETQYTLEADKLTKTGVNQYSMEKGWFTACDCPEGENGQKDVPWKLTCGKADISRGGFATAKDVSFKLYDFPVFYSPYFFFPVLENRQSGFLFPRIGYSNRDGVLLDIPYYWVTDNNSDITFRPFVQSRTRGGARVDFRRAHSHRNYFEGSILYSNESLRDGDLRGTVVAGLNDPNFDEDRFGVYYKQLWQNSHESKYPSSFSADIHYMSDDLIVREMIHDDLGQRNDIFATSRVLLSNTWNSTFSTEISAEYNQALISDDDLIFQRLPELALYGRRSFRPFGYNPYGLKLTANLDAYATHFSRTTGFDGKRFFINPSLSMPYHYKNYFNGEFEVGFYQTNYSLDNKFNPQTGTMITDDSRTLADFRYSIRTSLEKVYDVSKDSTLRWLAQIGSLSQNEELKRIKHVIEPKISYHYVPFTGQDQLPLFDSLDRLRNRSLISYGVRSSWQGRFVPKNQRNTDIEEVRPEISDLPEIDSISNLSPWDNSNRNSTYSLKEGTIRELVYFGLRQNYDYIEDDKDRDPNRDALSDLGVNFGFFPSSYMAFTFDSNFNVEDQDFSSWSMATHLKDDRGDVLRGRYTYIDQNISQIEANAEIKISDRADFGVYGRYDERESEFIESRVALRLKNACNCWSVDIGFSDRINPDRKDFLVTFNFRGLGAFGQTLGLNSGAQ